MMKRLSLFGNPFHLFIVLVPVIAIVLLVGGQTLAGFRDQATISATQATAAKQQVETPVFQSPLPTPTSPPSTRNLQVVAIELVENGPYRKILWSPDGKKALISKQYTQYLLLREKDIHTEVPPGFVPGLYTGLGDLWLLDLVTGKEHRLAEKVGRYTWSPDSTQVAYLAPTEAEGIAGALYVLDIASGEAKRVASVDFLGSGYAPQWLPTGEIVYVRDGRLWSIQATGKQEKALPGFRFYNYRIAVEAGKPGYLDDREAPIDFHFSPDGKRVAYKTHRQNYRAISYRLWLADADGSNAQLITEQAEGSYYEWSPDSEWLVFNTYRDVDDPTMDQHDPGLRILWVVKADGSNIHPLYRADFWHWILSPAWSPDSSMVVFIDSIIVEKPDSPKGVFWQGSLQVADVERGETTPLKGLPENEEAPADVRWSPDGKHLFIVKEGDRLGLYQSYRLTLATE